MKNRCLLRYIFDRETICWTHRDKKEMNIMTIFSLTNHNGTYVEVEMSIKLGLILYAKNSQ